MNRHLHKKREEARHLYLTGEITTNAEIAARLKVKPHTIGRWRRTEDWDALKLKVNRRAAEMFVEKIASDKVTLNVRHYRFWELLLAKLTEGLKKQENVDIRDLNRFASIIERAQKGQRLAKGLSITGETEESVRAQSQVELQKLIDIFIDAVKENVTDEETRDEIRRAILEALPEEEDLRVGDTGDESAN